jgi:hypothetical protein
VVGTRDGEFRLTLDGPRLAVSSLTVPQDDAENDPRAALEQRFERVADAAHLLDALLELFLQRRTASDWDREVRTISKWISNGSKNGRPRVVSA